MRRRALTPRRPRVAPFALVVAVATSLACQDQIPALDLVQGGDGTPVGAPIAVTDRLYVVPGGGGNTAVLVTTAGIVVVDPKYASSWPALERAIRTISDAPITHAIVTHSHSDHAEAVVKMPESVRIVAQANTLERMMYYRYLPRGSETNGRGVPFVDRLELVAGADRITLLSPGAAHTDGDALVYFHSARTLHTGDVFAGRVFPIINIDAGGDGRTYADALARTLDAFPEIQHVLPGHSAVTTRDAAAEYADFVRFAVDYVDREMGMFKDKNVIFRALALPARFGSYDMTRQFDTLDEIDRSLRPRWQRVF
jgi:glyoxylase-like metal-dependent hydrolase (beta-lactamase superfamily II)